MTTIATDGKSIASDGRMTLGCRVIREDDEKIFKVFSERTGETLLVGIAGYVCFTEEILEYIKDTYQGQGVFLRTNNLVLTQEHEDAPEVVGTEALILTEGGKVFHLNHGHPPLEISKVFAIGSGGDVAIGAMLAGKSPEEAVLIAAKVDTNTNTNVRVVHSG